MISVVIVVIPVEVDLNQFAGTDHNELIGTPGVRLEPSTCQDFIVQLAASDPVARLRQNTG